MLICSCQSCLASEHFQILSHFPQTSTDSGHSHVSNEHRTRDYQIHPSHKLTAIIYKTLKANFHNTRLHTSRRITVSYLENNMTKTKKLCLGNPLANLCLNTQNLQGMLFYKYGHNAPSVIVLLIVVLKVLEMGFTKRLQA